MSITVPNMIKYLLLGGLLYFLWPIILLLLIIGICEFIGYTCRPLFN